MPANDDPAQLTVEDGRIVLKGRLDAASTATVWRRAVQAAKEGGTVDASGVTYCDSSGAALFYELEKQQGAKIEGLPTDAQGLLKPYAEGDFPKLGHGREKKESSITSIGRVAVGMAIDMREQLTFTGQASVALLRAFVSPRHVRWGDMWRTVETAGVNALVIVGMIGFLTGMIMAFQSTVPLQQFGVDIFVVNLVSLAMLRELGGIMTAIVLAGRSGSAFAAEIGTMKVNEEVSALTTMGLDPVRFLVVPKLMAAIIVTPLLTIYANVVGIMGGLMVVMIFGHPWAAIYNQLISSVNLHDIATGLIKSFFFGALVGGIGCLRGLQTKSGASAVGESTTRAVVSGIFLIIVVDAVFAVVFWAIKF
ncbi:MAG TPA: MlaE family lipid ABC transporter permease subunit [Chthoniobacterales bacterium]|nr:MlaE family lipid ABC transporter permease subunit [Chthoniobacterales bacterium]